MTRMATPGAACHMLVAGCPVMLAIMILALSAGAQAGSHIEGELEPCSDEGKVVEVPITNTNPCIKTCRCLGGLVTCDRERCPMTELCYLVVTGQRIRPDSCCERCKGCQTPQGTFSDGQEWRSSTDTCTISRCYSGVLTIGQLKCHTPCSRPLPPLPGECCPRCPSCQLPGRDIKPGQNLTLLDDPCVTCSCDLDGRQSCTKQVCPALSCSASESHRPQNHCCPICTGKRRVLPDARDCQLGSHRYQSGETFMLDPCTNCTCAGSTSVCRRTSCPRLDCPRLQQVHRPDRCCPTCRPPARIQSVCRHMRRQYKDGQTWQMGPCITCNCTGGQISCEAAMCAAGEPECGPGSHAAKLPGHCCKQCVEDDAVCTVFGDPHYRTFDGKIFNYQGTCKYLLAKDCQDKTFSIRVNNYPRNSGFFSWTRSATVKIGDMRIALRQKKQVKVNGKVVQLPFLRLGQVTILQDPADNFNVLVKLSALGVAIVWDGDSFLQLKVPPSYKNKTCGLCGNYNGNKTDDFTTKRGRLAKLTKRFARSWRVGGRSHCSGKTRRQWRRQRKHPPTACGGDREARANAVRQCNRLKSATFSQCHDKVHPAAYFKPCVQDMCECDRQQKCYCEALTAYAHACRRLGVHTHWTTATGCAASDEQPCAEGRVPVDCVGCQPSCTTPEPAAEQCAAAATCHPGCVCPAGTLLHGGACVPADRCPNR